MVRVLLAVSLGAMSLPGLHFVRAGAFASPGASPTGSPVAIPTPVEWGRSYTYVWSGNPGNDWQIRVTGVRESKDADRPPATPGATPQPSYVTITLSLNVINLGRRPQPFPAVGLRLRDASGTEYGCDRDATIAATTALTGRALVAYPPGLVHKVVVVFFIPAEYKSLDLTTDDSRFTIPLASAAGTPTTGP